MATRKRRQAKGLYLGPTKAQKEAFNRYLAGGIVALLPGDATLLATHVYLAQRQRDYFAVLAAEKGEAK